MSPDRTKVFFSCSGVGIFNRGIESFFREAFDGLRLTEGLDITLFKGAGNETSDERLLWNLPRTGYAARFLGKMLRRNAYVIEQLSTFPSMTRAIRRKRPAVIFYSDSNLGFQLYRWRKRIGIPFRLLFSNGGPCHPPFARTDFVHQVAPLYREEALAAGESAEKHFLIPYGINVPTDTSDFTSHARLAARKKLNLPLDRPIVLSVGWIAAKHKRMDYLVREIATLPEPRPYLVLLGQMDEQSAAVIELATRLLGPNQFTVRSVPYQEVSDYYKASNLFAMASLREGFGRVYIEALIHGLPVIAHNHPVMQYVLGGEGILADLSVPGVLATHVFNELQREPTSEAAARRRESVSSRFSWPVLTADYRQMFLRCSQSNIS